MKKFIIGVLLCFVCAVNSHAQITLNFPHPFRFKDTSVLGTTSETYELWSVGGSGDLYVRTAQGDSHRRISDVDLNALLFVHERSVFVVGNAGEILLSADRGKTWEKQVSNTKSHLTNISCLDENNCWIVGSSDGLLLRGGVGKPWTQQRIVNGGEFTDVAFVNRSVGYVVGRDGIFLKTEDGGNEWVRINIPSRIRVTEFIDGVPTFEAVVFKTVDKGCVAGWDVGTGFVACTRDGGRTWNSSNIESHPIGLVWAKNDRIFVVGEYGENFVSKNLGRLWQLYR